MKVIFWGTRGSIPYALDQKSYQKKLEGVLEAAHFADISSPEKIKTFLKGSSELSLFGTYGGDTSCVQLNLETESFFLCDAGSGLRKFGNQQMKKFGPMGNKTYHFFISHLHWDHIMGFPFFVPAYIPGNILKIHSSHPAAKEGLMNQNKIPNFPVPFEAFQSEIQFIHHPVGEKFEVDGVEVQSILQNHGGDSYSYRFEKNGKSVVYSTDAEHKKDSYRSDYPFVTFCKGADLLIFDSMYSFADTVSIKEDWGHSSNIFGVELAQRAGVGTLCLFHHEPVLDDEEIHQILKDTIEYEKISVERDHKKPLKVIAAYDSLEVDF